MIRCSQCGKRLDGEGANGVIASICAEIMGDEYVDSYYFCEKCSVYTLGVYHDRFLNEDEVLTRGPLSKAEGDQKVSLIRQCPESWDKKCRCPAHRAYFGGSLD